MTKMDLDRIIASLKFEKLVVEETIRSLERLDPSVSSTHSDSFAIHLQARPSGIDGGHGRYLSEERRRRLSEIKKQYWAEWRRKQESMIGES